MRRQKRRNLFILFGFSFLTFVWIQGRDNTGMSSEQNSSKSILKALGSTNTSTLGLVLPYEVTVVRQPDPSNCKDDGTEVYTLFMVISSPQKRRERDTLRSSLKALLNSHNDVWRKDSDSRNNTLLFFTGLSSDPQLQSSLEDEARIHGDLVVDNMIDTYYNLTLKVLRMFKWVQQSCSEAEFVVKLDDDVHLNLLKFFEYLNQVPSGTDAQNLIGGQLRENTQPVRSSSSPYSKWYIPMDLWPAERLPNFVAGFCYVLGRGALREIYSASLTYNPLFHLEDVFLTGIIASHTLHMKLSGIPNILGEWPPLYNFYTPSCAIQKKYMVVHPLSAEDLRCWKLFNQKDFICDHWPIVTYC